MNSFDAGRVPPMSVGAGRLIDVAGIAEDLGGGPVLVVADKVLAELGVTSRSELALAESGLTVEIAADVAGEPKDAMVDALAERARAVDAGVIVGLGGGAAMDAAKLVAAIARAERPARHYALCANGYPSDRIPAIAIPTTAGTGSEVTRTSVVSSAEGNKYWYWGEELMFSHAVLDPELTASLPPHITAWTGMDAVAHALEATTSRKSNAVAQVFGLQALELLAEFLPKAVADGADVDVRGKVLWASTLAGLALHNCNTHMGHNISHALGSLAPVHHGLATALALEVTLPELVSRPEGRENYARAAAALGSSGYAASLPEAFSKLMRACGIGYELPSVCASVRVHELATHMKNDYNIGMAQNAACQVSNDMLDQFAEAILDLPRAAEKAA
ncbi:MAG: iron-containing alcohol dehydrogenase [Pseudomonadota bacterium]